MEQSKRAPRKVSPDKLCARYASAGIRLVIRRADARTILIRGNKRALEFLAKLLVAQANANDDCFQISPSGAGPVHFGPDSRYGLYFQRTPE